MIAEFDRYQGVVLRQILLAKRTATLSVVDTSGRVDAFSLDGAAFQIKHSTKRLSPWHFTYVGENLDELASLSSRFRPIWAFFVCGDDGVVGLSLGELRSIVQLTEGGSAWVKISRSRNSMYRVSGTLGDLPRAKARGVEAFLIDAFGVAPGGVSAE